MGLEANVPREAGAPEGPAALVSESPCPAAWAGSPLLHRARQASAPEPSQLSLSNSTCSFRGVFSFSLKQNSAR